MRNFIIRLVSRFFHVDRVNQAVTYGKQGIWSTLEYVFYPALMLAATPLFLHSLGTHQYGQWMFLLTIGSLGGLAGFGMGAATIKEVSAGRSRGDLAFAAQTVKVASFIVTVCSVTLLLLLICVWALGGEVLFSRIGSPNELMPLILGALCLMTLEQLDSVYAGALRGLERFDVSARLEVVSKFAIVLGALAVALLWSRLDWMILVGLILNCGRLLLKVIVVSRFMGQGTLWPWWHRPAAARVVQFGKWSLLQSLGSALFSAGDRLVIGSVLGTHALAGYSVCLQLAQQVHSLPAAFSAFLFPVFSRKFQSGLIIDVRGLLVGASLALALVAGLIALPLWILAEPILQVWVGAELALNNAELLAWLVLGHWVLALNIASHFLLYGANEARLVALANVVAGFVALSLTLSLVQLIGIEGAALSRLAYGVVVLCFYILKLKR